MNKDELKTEYASLLQDVTEHAIYLEELGVTHADIVLPNAPVTSKTPTVKEFEVPQERIEKFIPKREITAPDQVMQEKPADAPVRRRRNLGDSKLSQLKVESTPRAPITQDRSPEIISNEMPKETKLKDAVFSDITEALPESNETLEDVRADIGADCDRCGLCEKRTQVVHSKGNPNADLMFIGEAPGADEDEQGAPFVGRAGKLLTKIIEAIDLTRDDVFIGNINRCRPPGNRQPQADEVEVCKPFLLREIAVVKPKVIVVMGNTACQNLLETKVGITKLRGTFKDYFGVKVMPTFHPAYLLRDPRKKREVWEDLKTVRAYLDQTNVPS